MNIDQFLNDIYHLVDIKQYQAAIDKIISDIVDFADKTDLSDEFFQVMNILFSQVNFERLTPAGILAFFCGVIFEIPPVSKIALTKDIIRQYLPKAKKILLDKLGDADRVTRLTKSYEEFLNRGI